MRGEVGVHDAQCGRLGPPLLLDRLHQFYGNRRLLEDQYAVMRRSLEFIQSQTDDFIIHVGLGDWLSLEKNNTEVTSTALYYQNAMLVAKMAETLGHQDDAVRFSELGAKIKEAFIARFLKPGTGQIDTATQTAQAFALYHDLLPSNERPADIKVLIDNIQKQNNGHLSTGIFGTRYLLEILTQIGRVDVAFTIANQTTFPGWGHMLESGATTFWEDWKFSDNTYSHNHSMFGTVSAWFFSALAGIQPAPDAIGFDRIVIHPRVAGDLAWVNGSYNSIHGPIVSNWRLEDDTFYLDVEIPVNTSASVFLPAEDAKSVTEGGQPADQAEGVTFLRMDQGKAVYRVESGNYSFTAKVNAMPAFAAPLGVRSTWNGFARYDFKFEGREALVVVPAEAADGRPWVWRARFFGDPPEVDVELLRKGFHVAYIDVAGLFGSPAAMEIWDRFYERLTETHGLSSKVALEGTSRGGLFVFNWAARNPENVACIYADAPVCDIKSWPAGKLKGKGNPTEWANLLKAYGMTEDEALNAPCNPIDHLEPLAKAKIHLLHVVGDADPHVPVSENTALVEQRYVQLGGTIEVIHKPGVEHVHGLTDPTPIVKFILNVTVHGTLIKEPRIARITQRGKAATKT